MRRHDHVEHHQDRDPERWDHDVLAATRRHRLAVEELAWILALRDGRPPELLEVDDQVEERPA